MKSVDIEPGMILLGKGGEVREVVSVYGRWATYTQDGLEDQEPKEILKQGLARLSVRDITGLLGGVA